MTEREKYVEQLRELADFYAGAPDNLTRPNVSTVVYVEKDDIPIIIRSCRKLKKTSSNGYLSLSKSLDYGSVSFRISQGEVCERMVVGQKFKLRAGTCLASLGSQTPINLLGALVSPNWNGRQGGTDNE